MMKCTCWLGEPGATFGDYKAREACAVHGDANTLDLMRDEFARIKALVPDNAEIVGLCDRAVSTITQRVPVIAQRDSALRRLAEAEEVVGKLPKTRDGVPITPAHGPVFTKDGEQRWPVWDIDGGIWACSALERNLRVYISSLYSTRDAALAHQSKGDTGPNQKEARSE